MVPIWSTTHSPSRLGNKPVTRQKNRRKKTSVGWFSCTLTKTLWAKQANLICVVLRGGRVRKYSKRSSKITNIRRKRIPWHPFLCLWGVFGLRGGEAKTKTNEEFQGGPGGALGSLAAPLGNLWLPLWAFWPTFGSCFHNLFSICF